MPQVIKIGPYVIFFWLDEGTQAACKRSLLFAKGTWISTAFYIYNAMSELRHGVDSGAGKQSACHGSVIRMGSVTSLGKQ